MTPDSIDYTYFRKLVTDCVSLLRTCQSTVTTTIQEIPDSLGKGCKVSGCTFRLVGHYGRSPTPHRHRDPPEVLGVPGKKTDRF